MEGFRVMELPHSKTRQAYIEQISVVEANLKEATSGAIDRALLSQVQKRLDTLAGKYQYNEEIGTARYKLYELQALVHFFKGDDDTALDFINQAIETRGDSYSRAEKLKAQILKKSEPNEEISTHRQTKSEPPLQLQALIKGTRSSAIVMAVLSLLSIYFSPWAIFYIILAAKLKPERVPSRGLIKAAAIATLPLCIGIIPIIIDIEFWKMNKKLREYEELGDKAFTSDKEWQTNQAKHKKGGRVAKIILITLLAIVGVFIIAAVATSIISNRSSDGSSFLSGTSMEPYTSSEHGFKVNFPGFPETEHTSADVEGRTIPLTQYSKFFDNDSKGYMAQTGDYPADLVQSGNERGMIDGAINGTGRSSGFTLLSSSNDGTTQGYPSGSASYTATQSGQSYDVYTIHIVRGNKLYTLMSIGVSKDDFDAFASSFQFI